MAKEIIWSFNAREDKKRILKYYREKISEEYFDDTARKYAQYLNQLFQDAVEQIVQYPEIGRVDENVPTERILLRGNYQIHYQDNQDSILILHIWDSRQDWQNR